MGDSKVINIKDGITSTTADLTFAKIVNRGKRKIGFVQFKKGLQELANRSSVSYEDIEGKILAKGGPTARGSRAACTKRPVRWCSHSWRSFNSGYEPDSS